jgi:hypothetical protein
MAYESQSKQGFGGIITKPCILVRELLCWFGPFVKFSLTSDRKSVLPAGAENSSLIL